MKVSDFDFDLLLEATKKHDIGFVRVGGIGDELLHLIIECQLHRATSRVEEICYTNAGLSKKKN